MYRLKAIITSKILFSNFSTTTISSLTSLQKSSCLIWIDYVFCIESHFCRYLHCHWGCLYGLLAGTCEWQNRRFLIFRYKGWISKLITNWNAESWILKGIELLFRDGLENYGWIIIVANWVPGIVASMHILHMYRTKLPAKKTILFTGQISLLYPKIELYDF